MLHDLLIVAIEKKLEKFLILIKSKFMQPFAQHITQQINRQVTQQIMRQIT